MYDIELADKVAATERFHLRAAIGAGSMGVVYRAWDHLLEREVALKLFHAERESDIQEISREVAVAQKLHHPGFVRVHDVVRYAGALCISMEWVSGHTLRERLEQHGALSLDDVISLGVDLADALGFAHDNCIAHCDVKPENIVIDGGRFRLIDFGLAVSLTSPTRHSEPRGSQLYMSPEQRQGLPVDYRTDIYSIGVILFEAAVGRQLSLSELASGAEGIDRDLRNLPAPLRRVIRRCLRVQPGDRFAAARDIALALKVDSFSFQRLRSYYSRLNLNTSTWAVKSIVRLVGLFVVVWLFANGLSIFWPKPTNVVILPISAPPVLQINAAALHETLWSMAGSATGGRIAVLPPGTQVAVSDKWTTSPAMVIEIALLTDTRCQLTIDRRWHKLLHWRSTVVITSREDSVLSNEIIKALASLGITMEAPSRGPNLALSDWRSLARVTYNLARYRRDIGKLREAVAECNQIIEHANRCGVCYLKKAEIEVQMFLLSGDISYAVSARGDVNEALLLARSPQAWIRGARVFLRLHDRESLKGVFNNTAYQVLARQQGLAIEGAALAEDGVYDFAIAALKKAVDRNPFDINTANDLALAQMSAGRYSEAIKSFEKILMLTPDNNAALNNISLAYLRAGLTDQAIQSLERVLNVGPAAESYSNLGMALLYSGKSCVVAIPYFEKGAELAPRNEAVLGYLAHTYRWCGMQSRATDMYKRAMALARELVGQSTQGHIYMDLAVYAAALGDSNQFESYLHLARRNSGSLDYDFQYKAAVAFALLGDTERASDSVQLLVRAGYSRTLLAGNPDLARYRDIWEH